MEENKSTDFIPENPNEEYAMLIGRLKAFEAWARNVSEFDFKKDICFILSSLS